MSITVNSMGSIHIPYNEAVTNLGIEDALSIYQVSFSGRYGDGEPISIRVSKPAHYDNAVFRVTWNEVELSETQSYTLDGFEPKIKVQIVKNQSLNLIETRELMLQFIAEWK
ncbi:hypothetical protein [Shewanella algae]|uniref:hypothetical protein n=1 Tax=Shewanella algae TaxID=38313 RepID=UPI0034D3F54E